MRPLLRVSELGLRNVPNLTKPFNLNTICADILVHGLHDEKYFYEVGRLVQTRGQPQTEFRGRALPGQTVTYRWSANPFERHERI